MNILIYTKSNCPNCVTAKQLLKSKGLEYVEQDFDGEDEDIRAEFIRLHPDVRQMPQVFINSQRVGGLAGLQAALKELGL
jgi:glutaredoxin 3